MLRNRLLILLGGCCLSASAAWADGVGFIDCRDHPDQTPVFGKARQTHDTVASLPCGERFTIVLNGFIFSRIQTKDGQIGYIYSNLITADRSGSVPPPTSTRLPGTASPAPVQNVPAATTTVAPPSPAAPAQVQPTPAQPTPAYAPAATSNLPSTAVTVVQPHPATPAQTQSAPAQPAPTQAHATASSVPETPATIFPRPPTAPTQPEPSPAQLATTETTAPIASGPETPATYRQPEATPAPQPEPAPAEPAAPAIRAASTRESWEKPNAGLRRMPLIELFGGYEFARLDGGGGTGTNLHGALGSFGWNLKPWLQIVADTSYNVVTISGTKNVLYGNHWGPRFFRHTRNRWGATPFVEALVGGSRADTTVTGTGGYSTSTNCLSYKVGGGLDIHPYRHFEIRLFDVDYYRTAFGVSLHQNNYSASAGIVLRLFGGGSE